MELDNIVGSDYTNSAKEQIAKAINCKRNILVEPDITQSIVSQVANELGWELVEETNTGHLSSYFTDDGGILAFTKDGGQVECFPKWAVPIIDNPNKNFVVFLDFLDYTNKPIFKWLQSILNHIIAGRVVNNYIVVGHVIGGAHNFDYYQLSKVFNQGV